MIAQIGLDKWPEKMVQLHTQMPSGAKLVLIEFKTGKLPEGPPETLKIPKDELVELCKGAGFTLKEDKTKMLPYQEIVVFERK